ncbi:MAG: glycosyltransferase family 2 protein [bacterium]|nr:glycosyltransferase family 2 protein [bacterium]
MKISVAIITLNDAEALDRCLHSVAFADQVVVLDQGSTDSTAEVCACHGVEIHQSEWLGFGLTKGKAVGLCRNNWILSVDTDEVVTEELKQAINDLPDDSPTSAYKVNRLSSFLGVWIHHCGWHPERIVRLFHKERAGFNDLAVHEFVETHGSVGRLEGLLHHYTYTSMEQYSEKTNRYSTLAAEMMHKKGKKVSLPMAALRSQVSFWRMWILQGGILDGGAGLVLCLASSFYVLSKYIKLWKLNQS